MTNFDKPFILANLIDYQEGSIVSRVITKSDNGNITLFAFDEGQELSEHKTPFDALVQILDGQANIVLAGEENTLKTGDSILMPANIPHAVKATEKFKMLLTMIKE